MTVKDFLNRVNKKTYDFEIKTNYNVVSRYGYHKETPVTYYFSFRDSVLEDDNCVTYNTGYGTGYCESDEDESTKMKEYEELLDVLKFKSVKEYDDYGFTTYYIKAEIDNPEKLILPHWCEIYEYKFEKTT